MRRAIIIVLHAFVVPGLAKEMEVKNTMEKSAETLEDKLTSKLMDKLLGMSARHGANLDDTTFAKTHPDRSLGLPVNKAQTRSLTPHARSQMLASLPGPPAIKNAVMSAIEANNRRCPMRDVSMRAAVQDVSASGPPMSKEKVMAMPGISAPLGLFDPLGITTKVPEGRLLFYREAELKHGRVCMLSILGLLVGERHDFIPLLGNDIPADTPAYLLGTPFVADKSLAQFWPLALLLTGMEDWRRAEILKMDNLQQGSAIAPGDYGWDPLNLKPPGEKEFKDLQTKELNNGRLAMFATAGIIAQEQLTGKNLFFHN